MKTPVLDTLFNKLRGLNPATLLKEKTSIQVFFDEFCTKNSYGFETKNIKTVHSISKTIAFLDPKKCDPVPKKIEYSENINIFKSTLKSGN